MKTQKKDKKPPKSPARAKTKTKPPRTPPLPDDNVADDGRCILAQDAEGMGRQNTGEPCDDGRAG